MVKKGKGGAEDRKDLFLTERKEKNGCRSRRAGAMAEDWRNQGRGIPTAQPPPTGMVFDLADGQCNDSWQERSS